MSESIAQSGEHSHGSYSGIIAHWLPSIMSAGCMVLAILKGCVQDDKISQQQRQIDKINADRAERDGRGKQ